MAVTPNYSFNKPSNNDSMADFETWINANWDKIVAIPAPDSGATLPQAGSYSIGDRFYLTTTKSIYILIVKDANWGWHWRPVQDAISPWFTVPTTCLNLGTWTLNPVPANPFQIAFDHRGKCHWRGVVGITAGTFARNTSHMVFKPLPRGLAPRQPGAFMLGHDTLAVGVVGTALDSYQGARIYLFGDGSTSNPSIRGFGGTADFNRVHFGGAVQYAVGTADKYLTP